MAEKNIQNKITLDTSEFDRAIKQLNSNLKLTASEIKLLKSGTEDYTKTTSALEKALTQNTSKLDLMKQKYAEIVKTYGEGSKEANNYAIKMNEQATKVNLAAKALDEYKNGTKNVASSTEDLKVKLDYLSLAFYDLAKNAIRQCATALVDFTKNTVNVGSSFESSFADVKKVVSGTTEEMTALENEIRQTALEKPISADALASLYKAGAQLGIARDDLKDFTSSMIDLQNTSNLTAENGATMIAQYANITHLKADEYRNFASTLSYLGSTTATTENDIMNLTSRISGAGVQIGLSHQQMLALATAMGSVGISAESGGSAISTIMSNIDKSVDKNNENLKTWAETAGMSATEFATLWKTDVMSALQAVIKGMSDTKSEGGSLNLLLSDLGVNNIRQLDTMKKLASASDLLTECVSKANDEWKSAQFLTTATVDAYNTLEAKTLVLQNSFKEMQISIYEGMQEPLKEAATELSSFLQSAEVNEFAGQISNVLSSAIKTAVELIKGLVLNFDKVLIIGKSLVALLATMATRFIALKAINFATTLVDGFNKGTAAVKLFSAALNTTPIGLLATGIAVATTAIASFCIEINKARNGLSEVEKQIQETNAERERTLTSIDSEYNKYDSLVQELKTLVDENGNVKEGYQDRVNTIIPLLESATGTEIQLINNQIVGYNELMSTLDDVIAKKRMQAKINAYQGDYEEALKNEEELAQKQEEAQKKINVLAKSAGSSPKSMQLYNDAKRELKDIEAQIENNKNIQEKYNALVKEQYEYTNKAKTANTETKTVAVVTKQVENKGTSTATTNAVTESSGSTYQELLSQQNEYKSQLNDYVTEMKNGNSEVTAEMVEDTQNNLSKVEKRIKSLQELMGDAVEDIANKSNAMENIVDNEESSYDDDTDEPQFSTGTIFGAGVLGENAVEMEGAGKEAAVAYLKGYKAQQMAQAEAMAETLNQDAMTRVANEALAYQAATIAPENLELYNTAERQLALAKETAQAQGLSDYSYLITNATTMVTNLARQAAMSVDFEIVGLYICQGIARGIQNNKSIVIDAVRSMMQEANEAAEDEEEIASPSKVFYGYGKYIDEGLANGIRDYSKEASNQVQSMAQNIQGSVAGIKTNLGNARLGNSATIGNSGSTINYNFTQNNTSNKSLDTLAIYQESKSMLKRATRNIYV